MYDFEVLGENDLSSALKCRSERAADVVPETYLNAFIHHDGDYLDICCSNGPNLIDIYGGITRGWSGTRATEDNHRIYYLTRRSQNAKEGFFTFQMHYDIRNLRGLYILYPSELT